MLNEVCRVRKLGAFRVTLKSMDWMEALSRGDTRSEGADTGKGVPVRVLNRPPKETGAGRLAEATDMEAEGSRKRASSIWAPPGAPTVPEKVAVTLPPAMLLSSRVGDSRVTMEGPMSTEKGGTDREAFHRPEPSHFL